MTNLFIPTPRFLAFILSIDMVIGGFLEWTDVRLVCSIANNQVQKKILRALLRMRQKPILIRSAPEANIHKDFPQWTLRHRVIICRHNATPIENLPAGILQDNEINRLILQLRALEVICEDPKPDELVHRGSVFEFALCFVFDRHVLALQILDFLRIEPFYKEAKDLGSSMIKLYYSIRLLEVPFCESSIEIGAVIGEEVSIDNERVLFFPISDNDLD